MIELVNGMGFQPEDDELKEQIIQGMKSLHMRGLMTGVGGNASARRTDSEELWITPSGLYKPELKTSDLVKIDLEGRILEGILKPSMEWYFHTAIYKKRADINAVLHTHSPYTTGLAISGVKLKPITLEAATMLADVPILPFRYPGTEELGAQVGEAIQGKRAVILQNHGVIAVGFDLFEALSTIEILEEVSIMTFIASQFGPPKEIPSDQIELIKRLYRI
ncbi:MAG: class II aldolase/adducin family protein [Candidatus Bathyarchaeia archaeon]